MNTILQKRFKEAADRFAHMCPPIYVPDVMPYRKDAFEAGAYFAFFHQWISVEDALPEESDGAILVYVEIDSSSTIEHCVLISSIHNGHFSCQSKHIKPLAWMPIPKYERDKHEER